MFEKTRTLFLNVCSTDLEQAEIALLDRTACSNNIYQPTDWAMLCFLFATSTCKVHSKWILMKNVLHIVEVYQS